jgi:hypothetical protein
MFGLRSLVGTIVGAQVASRGPQGQSIAMRECMGLETTLHYVASPAEPTTRALLGTVSTVARFRLKQTCVLKIANLLVQIVYTERSMSY